MSVCYKFILNFSRVHQLQIESFLSAVHSRFEKEDAGWFWLDTECDWLIAGEFGKGESHALIVALVKSVEWRYPGCVQLLIACEHDGDGVPAGHFVNVDWENSTLPEGVTL